jgi:hypothetical protein
VNQDTCYNKLPKSFTQKTTAEDAYSVDMDSDFEEKEFKGHKKNKAKNQNNNGRMKSSSKSQKENGTKSSSVSSKPQRQKGNKNSYNTEISNCRRSMRIRTQSYNTKQKDYVENEDESSDEDESESSDDFSQKKGTVKAKHTQSRINKPSEKNRPSDNEDLEWTKPEINRLNR